MICFEQYVEPGAFPALETAPAPTKTQVWHGKDFGGCRKIASLTGLV